MEHTDMNKVKRILKEALTPKGYTRRLWVIAEALDKLNIDSWEEGEGKEELICIRVLEQLTGSKKANLKRNDLLDASKYCKGLVASIDGLKETETPIEIGTEDINEFTSLAKATNQYHVTTVSELLEELNGYKKVLLDHKDITISKILATHTKSNKQTVNDRLSDITGKLRDGKETYIANMIATIRQLSEANFKGMTKVQKIKNILSNKDVDRLKKGLATSREIYTENKSKFLKVGLEFFTGGSKDGSDRKLFSYVVKGA